MLWPESVITDRRGLHSPASDEAIERMEQLLSYQLPSDHKEFLRWANGGVLFDAYKIWSVEQIVSVNERWGKSLCDIPLISVASDDFHEIGFQKQDLLDHPGAPVPIYGWFHETAEVKRWAGSFREFIEIVCDPVRHAQMLGPPRRPLADLIAMIRANSIRDLLSVFLWPSRISRLKLPPRGPWSP